MLALANGHACSSPFPTQFVTGMNSLRFLKQLYDVKVLI